MTSRWRADQRFLGKSLGRDDQIEQYMQIARLPCERDNSTLAGVDNVFDEMPCIDHPAYQIAFCRHLGLAQMSQSAVDKEDKWTAFVRRCDVH